MPLPPCRKPFGRLYGKPAACNAAVNGVASASGDPAPRHAISLLKPGRNANS